MSSLAAIARISGVSLGAASKALSGKSGVSEATRQRVLSVATQQNYRTNRLVHAMQSGKSMMVGLACNDFRGDFSGRIVEGMLEVLYRADYDAIMISWDLRVHGAEKVLRTLAERRVDGLLMFPPEDQPSRAYLRELECFRRPVVVVDQTFAGVEDYDFVGSQDFEGGALAVECLVSLEHKNIANLYHRKTSAGRARLEGFRTAMQRHGLAMPDKWMREIQQSSTDEARRYARELLEAPNPPSAFVAFDDWVAMGVIAASHELGLHVPDDVSVVGFADLKVASATHPRLTTVAQDPLQIGRRAADRLLELLGTATKSDKPAGGPVCERLPVRLVPGESARALRFASTA